jgi:hypothetical protein
MRCCVAPDAEFSVEVIYGKAFVCPESSGY